MNKDLSLQDLAKQIDRLELEILTYKKALISLENFIMSKNIKIPKNILENQLFSKYAFFHPVLDELFLVSQYSNWQSHNTNNKILRVDAASFEVKSTSITDDIIDADGNPNLSIPIIAWVHNDELFYVAHNEGKTIYEVNSFKL